MACSWVYELLARCREEGEAAFEPRSRRPLTSPAATTAAKVELVLRIRKQLVEAGLDAGADTNPRFAGSGVTAPRTGCRRTADRRG